MLTNDDAHAARPPRLRGAPFRPPPWTGGRPVSTALRRAVRWGSTLADNAPKLADALSRFVGAQCQLEVGVAVAPAGPPAPGAIALQDAASGGQVAILVGAPLAARLLAPLLRDPAWSGIAELEAVARPSVAGALAAVLCHVAAGGGASVGHWRAAPLPRTLAGARLPVTTRFDGQRHDLTVDLWPGPTAPLRVDLAHVGQSLTRLGAAPIRLHAVIGRALGTRAELGALEPGDAWSCGAGWFGGANPIRAVLAAPRGRVGAVVALLDDGRARWTRRAERWDDVADDRNGGEGLDVADEPLRAVLEAPVEVRVEVGSVTMTAAEWAALVPGELLELRAPLGAPAVLRVGGVVVGRGELVELDGELAVRLLATGGQSR